MNHNAQKILFTEFAELKQGDGKGPKFLAGKAYWLPPDQAVRWKAEGIAEDAPADMAAENEPALTLRPDDVRIVRAGRNRYDVVGPNGMKFNDEPLSAHDAELRRKDIIENGPPAPPSVETVEPAEPQIKPEEDVPVDPEPAKLTHSFSFLRGNAGADE